MPFMPKIAKPQQVGVNEAVRRINDFRRQSSLSVLGLSRICSVNQPALARFLKGDRKTITSTARIVLEFIEDDHKRHNWHTHATIPKQIEDAVRSLWDGKPQSAALIASLIRALKPAVDIAVVRTGERSDGGTP